MALSATLLLVLQSGDRYSPMPEAGIHRHRPYAEWQYHKISSHGHSVRLPGKPSFDRYKANGYTFDRYRAGSNGFNFSALSSVLPQEVPSSEFRRAFDLISPMLQKEYPEGVKILKPFPVKKGNWGGYRSDIEIVHRGVTLEGDFQMLISGKRIILFQVNYNPIAPPEQKLQDKILASLQVAR